MTTSNFQFLKFVRYSAIDNWSFQYAIEELINYNRRYHFDTIGSFLTRNKTSVIVNNDVQYKRVTIRTNNGGCCIRDEKMGKEIGTKSQFLISKGQFIISKIDARNGAFGVVPDKCDNAIITSNFWAFDVNHQRVDAKYLSLITTTNKFIAFAEKASNGTTNRHYLQEPLFLTQKVPIPTLPEQQILVDAYNTKIKRANELEQQAQQIGNEIEDYFLTVLGISKSSETNQIITNGFKFLQYVRYKDINEWGFGKVKNKGIELSNVYPTKKVKDICSLGSGGTPSRSVPEYYKGNILWIKTGEVVNEEINETEEHISIEAINNSSAKIYPKGSLIIAMYGQGETRGRTAKLGVDAATNQACAVLYNINSNVVITDYLWYYFQGRYNDLRSLASGNNQPNLNAGMINNYDVVLPPLAIQNAIVNHINAQKAQIKQLKQQAETMRKQALKEFENEIFE